MIKNKYLVCLQVGGLMEDPEIRYIDPEIIEAYNEKEATEIYNKENNCNYFYSVVIDTNEKLKDNPIINKYYNECKLKNHILLEQEEEINDFNNKLSMSIKNDTKYHNSIIFIDDEYTKQKLNKLKIKSYYIIDITEPIKENSNYKIYNGSISIIYNLTHCLDTNGIIKIIKDNKFLQNYCTKYITIKIDNYKNNKGI